MTTPTFNKFKSTTIYGDFNNVDQTDSSGVILKSSSAYFQRNLSISGDLTCSGIIKGKKLYYNNVDISSTFVSNTTLNNYTLLSGATFTGNVSGITQLSTDNSSKFATTAYVKNQNYISSNPDLSTYALLSGATFSGTVNFNNGLTTLGGKDVNIAGNGTFPTTNSGGKTGLGFFWNKSGGLGEVNLLCYGQGGAGGLNMWASNTSNVPSQMVEFLPSGATFSTAVYMKQLVFTSVGTTSTPYMTTDAGNNLILSTATNNGIQFSTPSGGSSITANGTGLRVSGSLQVGTVSTAGTVVLQIGNGSTDYANLSVNGTTLNISQNVSTGNLKCTGLLDSTNASGTVGQIPSANGSGGWTWSTSSTSTNSVFGTQQILK
jgi:hypothetical protein